MLCTSAPSDFYMRTIDINRHTAAQLGCSKLLFHSFKVFDFSAICAVYSSTLARAVLRCSRVRAKLARSSLTRWLAGWLAGAMCSVSGMSTFRCSGAAPAQHRYNAQARIENAPRTAHSTTQQPATTTRHGTGGHNRYTCTRAVHVVKRARRSSEHAVRRARRTHAFARVHALYSLSHSLTHTHLSRVRFIRLFLLVHSRV